MKTKKEAIEYVAQIQLTDNDKKSFETFTPLAKQMQPFFDSKAVVLCTGSEVREFDPTGTNKEKRQFTEFHLQPEGTDDPLTKVILAYNNRNIFVGENSLRDIGEKNIDHVAPALAAFTVEKIEMTGHFPMRRSKAAEELGYVPSKTFVSADWAALRAKYDESDDMKKAAEAELYDARPSF